MKKINLFLMLIMLGFGMMVVPTVQGADLLTAPCVGTAGGQTLALRKPDTNCQLGGGWNARFLQL